MTKPFGDPIRVLPGMFDGPLDEAGLADLAAGGRSSWWGFFCDMLGDAGSGGACGQTRGNYPLPAAVTSVQPLRTGGGRRGWGISFGGVRLSAEEFAARFPDIDQTMLDWWGNQSFPETLLRMIECQWRPWMDPHVKGWMYPEDGNLTDLKRPARPPVYRRPLYRESSSSTARPEGLGEASTLTEPADDAVRVAARRYDLSGQQKGRPAGWRCSLGAAGLISRWHAKVPRPRVRPFTARRTAGTVPRQYLG